MEYTKGEWKVGQTPPLSNWIVGVNLNDPMKMVRVANLYNNEDDAQLIAAAPDMYEACKDVMEWVDEYRGGHCPSGLSKVEQAITKAEGV